MKLSGPLVGRWSHGEPPDPQDPDPDSHHEIARRSLAWLKKHNESMSTIQYHNPDNLSSPGDPPWRFLVTGERVYAGDESWLPDDHGGGGKWLEVCYWSFLPKTDTYRTQRSMPELVPETWSTSPIHDEVATLAPEQLQGDTSAQDAEDYASDQQKEIATLRAELAAATAAREEAENASDELWLDAIAKRWNALTGNLWDTRDGETREEGIAANVGTLFAELQRVTEENTRLYDINSQQTEGVCKELEALRAAADALAKALELQNIWAKGALTCKSWSWDPDQHAAATESLEGAKAALSAYRATLPAQQPTTEGERG